MSNDIKQQHHDEIIELLPWFVNQTLDEKQMSVVSDHLTDCEFCQSEVEFLGAMNQTMQADAQTSYREQASVDKSLNDVMARIDNDVIHAKSKANQGSFLRSMVNRISDFLVSMPTGMQGGTAIAGIVVAVMAFQFYQGSPNDEFSVLSSSSINESAIRLSIEVASSMDQDEAKSAIQVLFDRHQQEIDISKTANGTYTIEISGSLEVDELNALVLDLNDQALVRHVELIP